MVEYADAEDRRKALAGSIGIEDSVWLRVQGLDEVHPMAHEDIDRSTPDKTVSVHFMRSELTPEIRVAVKEGAAILAGDLD
jgi:hypothetical protein